MNAFREKLLSIGYLPKGRTRARVREGRVDGHKVKVTTDEHGNTTTEHDTKDDRVDVKIRPSGVIRTSRQEMKNAAQRQSES